MNKVFFDGKTFSKINSYKIEKLDILEIIDEVTGSLELPSTIQSDKAGIAREVISVEEIVTIESI